MTRSLTGWPLILGTAGVCCLTLLDAAAFAYHRQQATPRMRAPSATPAAAWQPTPEDHPVSGPFAATETSAPEAPESVLYPSPGAGGDRQYLGALARQVLFQERDVATYFANGDPHALARRPSRTLEIACDSRYTIAERIDMLRRLQAQLVRQPSASDQIAINMAF